MSESHLRRFLLYAASAAAAGALLYAATRYLLVWLLPFLIAAAAAAAIEPAVRFLQERIRLRRGFSSFAATLFLLFLLGGLLSLLGTMLANEAYALLAQLPTLLDALPAALDALLRRVERYSADCPPWLREQIETTLSRFAAEAGGLLGEALSRLLASFATAAAAVPRLFLAAATSVLAIYFTSSSWPALRDYFRRRISQKSLQNLLRFRRKTARSALRWLRAELTLSALTFSELLLVLVFLREPYALLLAFFITLVDALPVFGTGTVLIPWAIVEALSQNISKSIILAVLYLLTLMVRNALEPHLLGAQANLPPIFSLLAMYLGFCAFGVAGMVLCPFLLLLAAQFRGETAKNGG